MAVPSELTPDTSSGSTFRIVDGLPVRTSTSAGPIFAERPLTVGKGKFSFAVNYQHGTWDRFEGQDLQGGVHFLMQVDMRAVLKKAPGRRGADSEKRPAEVRRSGS